MNLEQIQVSVAKATCKTRNRGLSDFQQKAEDEGLSIMTDEKRSTVIHIRQQELAD
jgi:hypothetical protein